jgi:hypothetical protein
MGLLLIDSENADRDLTSLVTVLTHSITGDRHCQARIRLGDGVKNLSGTGGNYQLTVLVAGQTVQPNPKAIVFDTALRAALWTDVFPAADGEQVLLKVLSPNAGETDVDVTAELWDVAPVAVDADGYVTPPDGALSAAKFAADVHVYAAAIEYREDAANETDHYTVVWCKNGAPLAAGQISNPQIQVVQRSDGSDLVPLSALDWDAGNQVLKYDATDAERNSGAEVLKVIVSATIDGATRSAAELVYRDV